MKILLHIGQSKTGSTALQASLSAADGQLRKHGIYYPQVGKIKRAHPFLSFLIYQSAEHASFTIGKVFKNFENAYEKAEESWHEIKVYCEKYQPEIVILSSEILTGTIGSHLKGVPSDLLGELTDDVQPIVYVRNPAQRYFSNMQEIVKGGKPIYRPGPLKIKEAVESYEREFGTPVEVLPFSRSLLKNGDIVQDFSGRFLADRLKGTNSIETVIVNETISAACMSLMLDFGHNLKCGEDAEIPIWKVTRRYLQKIKAYEEKNGLYQRPVLKQEVGDQIIRASTELLWLRDERGIEFEEIDYSTIDGELGSFLTKPDIALEELCEVNQELKNEIGANVLFDLVSLNGLKAPRSLFGIRETWNALPDNYSGIKKIGAFLSRRAANLKKRLSLGV